MHDRIAYARSGTGWQEQPPAAIRNRARSNRARDSGRSSVKPKPEVRRSVMVIGSGPIVIGQAAEFDYAGVQACRALREEGHRVVLVNSNPATIMTDPEVADAVYLEPLTPRPRGDHCARTSRRAAADARRTDGTQSGRRT